MLPIKISSLQKRADKIRNLWIITAAADCKNSFFGIIEITVHKNSGGIANERRYH